MKQVLQKQGTEIRHVDFPNGGVVSITTVLLTGAMIEATTVGDEGMVGIEAFFVTPSWRQPARIQVPDTSAERMAVADFRREMAHGGAFADSSSGRYMQVALAQLMQSTACNAVHQVQERCARGLYYWRTIGCMSRTSISVMSWR